MSRISKKDVDLLLDAGFDESDLGFGGGIQGVEVYETPEDYFARELIENACEQGECDLYDDILPPIKKVRYDDSHPTLYASDDYPGNEDPLDGVAQALRSQVSWLLSVKIGNLSLWQKRDESGRFIHQVKELIVKLSEEDKVKMRNMDKHGKRAVWMQAMREEWRNVWIAAIDSMWMFNIEETLKIKTRKGKELNMAVILADNLREIGYSNLPGEVRWITMVYFDKN